MGKEGLASSLFMLVDWGLLNVQVPVTEAKGPGCKYSIMWDPGSSVRETAWRQTSSYWGNFAWPLVMRTAKGFHSGGRKQTTSTAGDFKHAHARAQMSKNCNSFSSNGPIITSVWHIFVRCVSGLRAPGKVDSSTINITFTVISINLTISALDSTGLIRSRIHKQGWLKLPLPVHKTFDHLYDGEVMIKILKHKHSMLSRV